MLKRLSYCVKMFAFVQFFHPDLNIPTGCSHSACDLCFSAAAAEVSMGFIMLLLSVKICFCDKTEEERKILKAS